MVGAIVGDVVGSVYEFHNTKTKLFPFFCGGSEYTDDTVMTCAVAESLMRSWKMDKFGSLSEVAVNTLHEIGQHYPRCGYGGKFYHWMFGKNWKPYDSFGNGAAMRISAVGDIARSEKEAKDLSYKLTAITHNHAEGLKGAEAAVMAKYLLREGESLSSVERYINDHYYTLRKTVDDYRKEIDGHGKETCQVTMPQAFACLFESDDFEDVIRNSVSIGGDSDTIAAIAGGIAEAYYPVPGWMKETLKIFVPYELYHIVNKWDDFVYRFNKEEEMKNRL